MGRRIRLGILLVVAATATYLFLFGPLFPWSPWKPGYSKLALQRADVYYGSDTALPNAFRHVDSYITESEQFHSLDIPERIKVILCRNWGDFHRFMPLLKEVGAAALETGTVIYITPRIAERGFDFGEYLRHEISHATLNQHQTLSEAHASRKAPWFFEGLAVMFGRQRSYVTPREFVVFTMARDLVSVIDPLRARPDLPSDIRFNYQVWRYFLNYLIDTQGRDRFQQLMLAMMHDPGDSEKVFTSIYGSTLPDAIRQFRADVRSGKWVPAS